MKITESKIRQYIRKLLMETFYVQPDGVAMTRDQFANQKGNERIDSSGIPDNVPQIDLSFPAELAVAAKQEYEGFDPMMRDMYMQKLGPITFGDFYDEFLDNLTFSPSDLEYINPDVNSYLAQNKESFHQGIELMMNFLPKTAEYINHIAAISEQFSAGPDTAQYATLDPAVGKVFHNDILNVFFTPPDKGGNIGMGKSLTDYVVDKIMSSLLQVKSITPTEFADRFYPEFYKIIDVHFKNNPRIANNAQALTPIRDAYLDSIEYVLAELISELNFEFLYWGSGKDLTSKNPEDLLIFLPDDRATLARTAKIAHELDINDPHWDFKTYLGEIYRPGSWTHSDVPELRSMPDYYTMKFSINPNLADIAGIELKNKFSQRLWDNMAFGVGFRSEGVEIPDDLAYGGVGDLWQKS